MVDMLPFLAIAATFAAVAGVYYIQVSHAGERNRALREIRELAYSHAQALATLSRDQADERSRFQTESFGTMRAMYSTFVQHALRAQTISRANSAAEGAIAAGQLAQVDAAMDSDLQAKLMAIQEKVANHAPFSKPSEQHIPDTPKIIQDPSTGDVLVKM